jgi:hypothetical protein
LLWIENGLISKLARAHVVEKDKDDILFTVPFCKFMMKRLHGDLTRVTTPEDCRIILADFHSALKSLSDDEIGATMILVEYYFDNYNHGDLDRR